MKNTLLLAVAAACMLGAESACGPKKQVFCYYTSWATYRSPPGKYGPSDVDPSKCTIINYAFVGLWGDNGTVRVLDPFADFDRGQIEGVVALKQNNSALKVLISMGGWNEGSVNYSIVAANATLRKNFVASVVAFVQKYNFDGFDLDWEYPTRRGGVRADRKNFNKLLKELRAGLKAANSSYLLTAAVLGVGRANVSEIYDVPTITKYLDYINLMLYDFHVPGEVNYTYQAASIYASTVQNEFQSSYNLELSVIAGIEAWLSLGAVASKVLLGIPFYGHTWTLANNSDNGLWAPATGAGDAGNLTLTAGFLSYQEICLYRSNWTLVRDPEVISPYQYSGDQWLSFDDPVSVSVKAEVAVKYNLGGVMIWDLDYDDFNNDCGNGRYPLLTAINNVFSN